MKRNNYVFGIDFGQGKDVGYISYKCKYCGIINKISDISKKQCCKNCKKLRS